MALGHDLTGAVAQGCGRRLGVARSALLEGGTRSELPRRPYPGASVPVVTPGGEVFGPPLLATRDLDPEGAIDQELSRNGRDNVRTSVLRLPCLHETLVFPMSGPRQ